MATGSVGTWWLPLRNRLYLQPAQQNLDYRDYANVRLAIDERNRMRNNLHEIFAIGEVDNLRENILETPGLMEFLNRLAGCHHRALNRLHGVFEHENWVACKAARASTFHCLVMDEAKAEFAGDTQFRYVENQQLKTILTPWFEIRIKKASKSFRSLALNKTYRTEMWIHQIPLLPEWAPLDRVFIGYTVDKKWTAISELALVEYQNREIVDVIRFPTEVPDAFEEQTGGFIDVDFRIKEDSIKRTRQQEIEIRELDSAPPIAGAD